MTAPMVDYKIHWLKMMSVFADEKAIERQASLSLVDMNGVDRHPPKMIILDMHDGYSCSRDVPCAPVIQWKGQPPSPHRRYTNVWMARKMTEWPSKRGPITKIMPSDGCIGDTVPLAVGKWY